MTKKTWILILWVMLALVAFGHGRRWLEPEAILGYRDAWLALAQNHPLTSGLIFTLVYILATAISLPGASALSLIAGFLFGRWWGTLIVIVAATCGALLVFSLVRYLFSGWARTKLEQSPKTRRLMAGFTGDAFNYLLFLRLVPLFPFWLVNIAPAFTPVSMKTYGLATLIGILPGSFIFVNLGTTLGTLDHLEDLLSPRMGLALGLLGTLSLLPVLIKRMREKNRG